MDSVELTLENIYYDPEHPAAYGSIQKLYDAAKQVNKRVTLKIVKDWLSAQDSYTLHRSVNRKFKRVPTYADRIDSVWQLDTADVRHLAQYNSKVKYLLMIIDVLSRFAFVAPMTNKSAARVTECFKKIKKQFNRSPKCVVSDPGLEFRGKFTDYLKSAGIKQILLRVEQKAPYAERFIRTIKEKMVKYMTHNDTKSYLEVLPDIVRGYNTAVHRITKMKPIDVSRNNDLALKQRLYGHLAGFSFPRESKFQIGDLVRQVKKLKALDKGTTQTTTDEVFEIGEIIADHPPQYLYRLKDLFGGYIRGSFHAKELVKVRTVADPKKRYMKPGKLRVKKTKRIVQKFQTYKGWPRKFDVKLSTTKH